MRPGLPGHATGACFPDRRTPANSCTLLKRRACPTATAQRRAAECPGSVATNPGADRSVICGHVLQSRSVGDERSRETAGDDGPEVAFRRLFGRVGEGCRAGRRVCAACLPSEPAKPRGLSSRRTRTLRACRRTTSWNFPALAARRNREKGGLRNRFGNVCGAPPSGRAGLTGTARQDRSLSARVPSPFRLPPPTVVRRVRALAAPRRRGWMGTLRLSGARGPCGRSADSATLR